MIWRAGLVIALLSLNPLGLEGQQGIIRVLVLGAGDGMPVAQARVALALARRLVVTDASGGASIPSGMGEDTLLVAAIGFRPLRLPLALPMDSVLTLRLIPAPAVLPDLVTTAGRQVQRAAATTAHVETVDRRELDATAAASVDRAVGDLSGVQQNGVRPAGTTLQIRGLGESRVLLLVDGEPVSGTLIENRDLSRTSTLAVDRIEVTRGPSSLEHGSDALGGVINVVTAAPEGPFQISTSGLVGGDGRREGSVGVHGGGDVGFRITGGVREVDRVAGQESADATLERMWDLRSTLRKRLTNGWQFRADANLERTRQRWPVTEARNGFVDTWAGGGFVEAGLSRPWGDLRFRVVGQRLDYRYREAVGLRPEGGADTLDQKERVLRGVVALSRSLGLHRLSMGLEGSLRDVDAPQKIAGNGAGDRQVEGYAQDSWSAGRLLLNGGARVTANSRWGQAVTPSVGAAFELSPAIRFRGSVARGFRGPSMKELSWTFRNDAVGYIIQGNPDLRPESAWSFATGVSWAPANGLLATADVYRNSVHDLIDFAVVGTTPQGFQVYTPTNVTRARTEGVELSFRAASGPWIATVGYDYLRARNLTTDQPLDRRAHHTGRLRLTHLVHLLAGGALDLSARYMSEAPITGTTTGGAGVGDTQGAFLSLDMQASVSLVTGLRLAVGGDNLLDRYPANMPGILGRRIYVSARVDFRP